MADGAALSAVLEFLARGLWNVSWWQIALFALGMTHATMISVTIYLHRHQAHRALELSPAAAHAFRFWLWLTTGQSTKEWTSIHRKHHAKCEREGDPHSPHVFGIKTVLLTGYELYRAEAANKETMERYGRGTPDDWIERRVYSKFQTAGVVLMLGIDVALFGAAGLAAWAVQMAWTPVFAAGIINGAAHFWGYRNFEVEDRSTNISPWGILIAGEELHNNHHTYPTSAKLSVKPFEFDIGWMYISLLRKAGLATVRKTPPKLALGAVRALADEKTLSALVAHRFELMAAYAKDMRAAFEDERGALLARCKDASVVRAAGRWLHRDEDKVPASERARLALARAASPALDKMVVMREELRQMWLNRTMTPEQLARDLQAWCLRAEESGVAALREFSLRLRAARV